MTKVLRAWIGILHAVCSIYATGSMFMPTSEFPVAWHLWRWPVWWTCVAVCISSSAYFERVTPRDPYLDAAQQEVEELLSQSEMAKRG